MRILMIDIDTLRPDHLGCYGYERNTSPNIDQIAREGVRFDRYYCPNAPCLPSRASLVTGQYGIHNGIVGHGGTAADLRLQGRSRDFADDISLNNLFTTFMKAGLHTVSISTFAQRHSAWWFNAGFNECYNEGENGNESGEKITEIALDWVERNAEKHNWFLYLHYWNPHTPYRTPANYPNPFTDEPPHNWIDRERYEEHLKHVGPHSLNELEMFTDDTDPKYPKHPGKIESYEQLIRYLNEYDCSIRYTDDQIGLVLDALKKKGVYDDLAIILTSDHGENLGELGIYSEHATADEPTCHIPMLIRWPGGMRGTVDSEFHTNVDLAPTVADLLHVPKYSKWDGKSYAPTVLTGEKCGLSSAILTQCAHVCQRSAVFDDYVYIRTYHCGYHLFPREMLYNIKKDPHQLCNIAQQHPELCQKGAKLILDWVDEMMLTSNYEVDPLWTVMREGGPLHVRGELKRYLKRLRETGRAEGADRLLERYAYDLEENKQLE